MNWLNDKEEIVISQFVEDMRDSLKKKEKYLFIWDDCTELVCQCVSIHESDNDLELDDPNYEEYWGISIQILEIINDGDITKMKTKDNCIEVNYHNAPSFWKRV